MTDISDRPFDKIAIDLVTDLNVSTSGNQNILTIIDHLTGLPEAFPIPHKKADIIVHVLINNCLPINMPLTSYCLLRRNKRNKFTSCNRTSIHQTGLILSLTSLLFIWGFAYKQAIIWCQEWDELLLHIFTFTVGVNLDEPGWIIQFCAMVNFPTWIPSHFHWSRWELHSWLLIKSCMKTHELMSPSFRICIKELCLC